MIGKKFSNGWKLLFAQTVPCIHAPDSTNRPTPDKRDFRRGGNQPASPNGSVRETRKWVSVPFEARVRNGPPNIWSNRTEQV